MERQEREFKKKEEEIKKKERVRATKCVLFCENWAKCMCGKCHPRLACAIRTG
ncbi:hypothetical protein DPMN_043864 [Dreissena polymorpha]|uniref:Uncharacterized protein n=1 Tax=Dreissena polymorpha TaxID=45954 RepID=A0A9D4D197_DREPO|nr:hypothetical protein DPMN_043864 [Dreissena polymorpha]